METLSETVKCEYRPNSDDFRVEVSYPSIGLSVVEDIPKANFVDFMCDLAANPVLVGTLGDEIFNQLCSEWFREYHLSMIWE